MTIEIEPIILAEIKEQAKTWLDYETQIHERVIKEKRWDVIDVQECKTMREVCMGSIAHRIMEILYPEEHHRLMGLMLDALNMKKPLIEKYLTNRGFVRGEFTDLYGTKCSIQESSLADEPAIWLGVSPAEVKVMSVDAKNLSPPRIVPEEGSGETYGWSDYILPDKVHVFSRMHLNIDMAKELVKQLNHFIKTGELPRDGIKED